MINHLVLCCRGSAMTILTVYPDPETGNRKTDEYDDQRRDTIDEKERVIFFFFGRETVCDKY